MNDSNSNGVAMTDTEAVTPTPKHQFKSWENFSPFSKNEDLGLFDKNLIFDLVGQVRASTTAKSRSYDIRMKLNNCDTHEQIDAILIYEANIIKLLHSADERAKFMAEVEDDRKKAEKEKTPQNV